MDAKDVRDAIRTSVSQKLKKHDFLFNSIKNRWEREISGGLQIFDLLFYIYPKEILVKPVFRLKLYLIEDIYHRVTEKSEEHEDSTETLGNSLGQIIKFYEEGLQTGTGESISYQIENAEDIEILKTVIPQRFDEYIIRYFDSNSSISRVDELLNEEPHNLSVHSYIYPIRACIGLIAAKLNKNPNYKSLVHIYDEKTKNANTINRREFENLLKELESQEFN